MITGWSVPPKQIEKPYQEAECVYFLFADQMGKIDKITGPDQLAPNTYLTKLIAWPGNTIEKQSHGAHCILRRDNRRDM